MAPLVAFAALSGAVPGAKDKGRLEVGAYRYRSKDFEHAQDSALITSTQAYSEPLSCSTLLRVDTHL